MVWLPELLCGGFTWRFLRARSGTVSLCGGGAASCWSRPLLMLQKQAAQLAADGPFLAGVRVSGCVQGAAALLHYYVVVFQ